MPTALLNDPYTVDSPNPVPLPTSLVVKKGSKTCFFVVASIPVPVSVIASITCIPGVTPACLLV